MFKKNSRYYKLNDVVIQDKNRRSWESKAVRFIDTLGGRFYHTIESGDRLDHLAYKYYRQSKQWWRICDANPEVFSPIDLLGQSPLKKMGIQLEWLGLSAPWYELFVSLNDMTGVNRVEKGNENQLHPETETSRGEFLFGINGVLQADLDAAVLSQVVSMALDTALQAEGVTLSSNVYVYANSDSQWFIKDKGQPYLYFFEYDGDADQVMVYETVVKNTWFISVVYNYNNLSQEDISNAIEMPGFTVLEVSEIGRAGRELIIPSKYVG